MDFFLRTPKQKRLDEAFAKLENDIKTKAMEKEILIYQSQKIITNVERESFEYKKFGDIITFTISDFQCTVNTEEKIIQMNKECKIPKYKLYENKDDVLRISINIDKEKTYTVPNFIKWLLEQIEEGGIFSESMERKRKRKFESDGASASRRQARSQVSNEDILARIEKIEKELKRIEGE